VTMECTVVIPTFGRKQLLRRNLAALGRLDSGAWEVVVVDDGSDEPVNESDLGPLGDISGRLVRHPENQGRAAARNTGIREAQGSVVVFLDDDMEPQPGFVSAHIAAHSGLELSAVVGHFSFPKSPPPHGFSRYFETRGVYKLGRNAPMPFQYFITGNSSVSRELLQTVGGFDESLARWGGEDLELGYRMNESGAVFRYEPLAKTVNHGERTISEMCVMSSDFGRDGIPTLVQRHPALSDVFRIDLLAPSTGTIHRRWSRRIVRTLTLSPFRWAALKLVSATESWRWPDWMYHYLIAAHWRKGLDEVAA